MTLFTTNDPPRVVRIALCACLATGISTAGAQHIAVDQLGYPTREEKAFKVSPRNAGGELDAFEIQRPDGSVVFAGRLSESPFDEPAAEPVYTGDFSPVDVPGEYHVVVGGKRSYPFRIHDNVYDSLYTAATRGLYVSRCGQEVHDDYVPHGVCHAETVPKRKEGGSLVDDDRDVTGGWHNGGDYRRSTLSAFQAVNRILIAVEFAPHKFDGLPSQLQEHERRGNLPDALVEAKFGLDWMLKMQDEEGGVSVGMGPIDDVHAGKVPPGEDHVDYYIGEVLSANTAKAGVVFARASRVFRPYNEAYADVLLNKAKLAYNYLAPRTQSVEGWPIQTVKTYIFAGGWEEDVMYLAAELYRSTGVEGYHDRFKEDFAELNTAFPDEDISTHTIRSENVREALLSYCLIDESKRDADIFGQIRDAAAAKLGADVDRHRSDGYRSVLPYSAYEHRHTIGHMLHRGWMLLMAHEAFGNDDYRQVALEQLHYLLGRNALGKVFVTGLGSAPVVDPHYRPTSIAGVAPPGLPVKGPTWDATFVKNEYTDQGKSKPARAKSYRDLYWRHQCNEPDVEVSGYLIAYGYYFGGGAPGSTPSNPAEPAAQLTVRARGTVGNEQLEVRLDGQRIGDAVTVQKAWDTYSFELPRAGVVRVGIVDGRDDGEGRDRNLQVDYLRVNSDGYTETLQAEDQAVNTGVWNQSTQSCGGITGEHLHCTGYIEFGQVAGSPPTPIVVYAAGRDNSEDMSLEVDGALVNTWTDVAGDFDGGVFATYAYDFPGTPAEIVVRFPDHGNSGHDLRVDRIEVGGVAYEAEDADAFTDGGGDCNRDGTERLWCKGGLRFDLAEVAARSGRLEVEDSAGPPVSLQPNPTTDAFRVMGERLASVTVYDLRGRIVRAETPVLSGQELDVSDLEAGIYLVSVRHTTGYLQSRRLVVR